MSKQTIPVFALIVSMLSGIASATTFPTTNQPFSQYGQIQNVQNYSSNPFWNPDAPYNQRMPVPVYIQGTDVDTGDCQRVVSALIASYCSTRNNCLEVSLEDAKPTITVQLASIPGHNYVTPCSGYIDTEFETYKKNNTNAAPKGKVVAFPEATVANPNINQQEVNFNILQPQQAPDWAVEMKEREQELEQLQSQNSSGANQVVKMDFPTTFADLSFTERQQVLKEGYMPYAGKSAYVVPNFNFEKLMETDPTVYVNREEAYCKEALNKIAILDKDLQTIQNCRANQLPVVDCIDRLQGQY